MKGKILKKKFRRILPAASTVVMLRPNWQFDFSIRAERLCGVRSAVEYSERT